MAVSYIPEGHHTVTPYLVIKGVPKLIEFLEKAFGAELMGKFAGPDGSIMHAEVRIGDSRVMMGEAGDKMDPIPAMLHLYVEDADASYQRALDAGAISVREVSDQFYGDRSGGVKDPSGVHWWIATHKEDVAPAELKKRAEAHLKAQQWKAA